MEITRETNTKHFHLAGIVPVAGQRLDFDQIWPDCLMPIAPNYTLIEAAVAECAWAGCDTIWVICNDDIGPAVKKKIGDFVGDPVWAYRKFDKYPNESKRQIPVYYVPVHPKDRDKRDCLAWSVLHGSLTAFKISDELSRWVIPNKYYVSFPYGYFPAWQLREHRKIISSSKNIYLTSEGKSMKDNFYTSFTFGKDEFIEFRRVIRTGTGRWKPGVNYKEYEALPIEERWSARFFELEQVFAPFDTTSAQEIQVQTFYNIGSWQQYKHFMAENIDNDIRRPSKTILLNQVFKPIGKDYLGKDDEST
jgi:hypothetical protein